VEKAMSAGAWSLWIIILVVGALNFFSRVSFIALFARMPMPALLARALRFVPAAMLTAIVVPPMLFRPADAADPALANAKLIATLVAAAVAWKSRSVTATIIAGMAALWLSQWLLHAAA
jgi:branched-subunit amino acid transport protein